MAEDSSRGDPPRERPWAPRRAVFGFVLATFALPFATVGCDIDLSGKGPPERLARVTGFELVSGTEVETYGVRRPVQTVRVPPQALAILALVAALAGGALTFEQGRRRFWAPALTALAGGAAALAAPLFLKEGAPEYGAAACTGLFVLAAALNAVPLFVARLRRARPPAGSPP